MCIRDSDNTIAIDEDGSHTFTTADFGFSDPVDQNNLQEVLISSVALTNSGSLTLNNIPVFLGSSVSAADISNGLLKFTPAANNHGTGYAVIEFRVRDDGGTANGGLNTSQLTNTITIDVNSVNDAPSGTDSTVNVNENASYVVAVSYTHLTLPTICSV